MMPTVALKESADQGRQEPDAARLPRPRRARSPFEQHRRRLYYPFILPAFVLYAAFLLAPLAVTAWISLHRWAGAGPMEWVGTRNYTSLLADPVFTNSFKNTLIILVCGGLGTFIISFGLMMVLREMTGRKFARSVIFFPTIVPALVVSILWGFLFNADGLVNWLLRSIGITEPPQWLAAENQFAVIVVGIMWTSVGFYTTILMAAVDRIPPYLYEDCALAGANAWQRFWNVTLPLSWDVVGVCAVLWTVNSIKTFEFVFAMAGSASGLPATDTWTVALYAYAAAFVPSGIPLYGASAASSVLTLALVAALVVLIRRLMKRDVIEF